MTLVSQNSTLMQLGTIPRDLAIRPQGQSSPQERQLASLRRLVPVPAPDLLLQQEGNEPRQRHAAIYRHMPDFPHQVSGQRNGHILLPHGISVTRKPWGQIIVKAGLIPGALRLCEALRRCKKY